MMRESSFGARVSAMRINESPVDTRVSGTSGGIVSCPCRDLVKSRKRVRKIVNNFCGKVVD